MEATALDALLGIALLRVNVATMGWLGRPAITSERTPVANLVLTLPKNVDAENRRITIRISRRLTASPKA
jgi:hypothetical protein